MPQLQSLHLHIQAPVLTEPGLDSLLSVWLPVLLFPSLSGSLPCSHLGMEAVPTSPLEVLSFSACPSLMSI